VHGVTYAARKQERSFTVEIPVGLHAVRQINGDLRIDDGDEGPMMTIQFFDTWATLLEDEEKDQVLEAVVEKMTEILEERNAE
jgi:tRNA threonylcarbamoyladenosine modification (KEOPS) complex Cgi121 subunit